VAVLSQTDLENALSVSTVRALFDDANDNTVNTAAVAAVIQRAEATVYTYIATEYPDLTLPVTSTIPESLKLPVLEFAIIFCRDRKPEYWAASQNREREQRWKAAVEMMDAYAKAKRVLYDSGQTPANVGGQISSGITDDTNPPTKFFTDGTGDF
jgi:hypothetical protein